MSDTTVTDKKAEEVGLTPAEKRGVFFFFLFLYWLAGCFNAFVMTEYVGLSDDTTAQRVGLVTLWPLFAVKYVFVGVWEVIAATYHLLT